MADDGSFFGTVAGFIQFPVEARDLDSGQTLRDATVRSINSGELVRITFWPDFEEAPLAEGDFIAVDGKVTPRTVGDKTYFNMSARKLASLPAFEVPAKEVENKKKSF